MNQLPPNAPYSASQSAPGVVIWYKVYLGFLAFLFLICVGVGTIPLFLDVSEADLDGLPPALFAGIYMGVGIVFLIPCLVGFFLRRTPGAWIFHLIMICIGMTGCTLVFSIPLLIFWIKPEVKTWYGRNP